MDKYLIGDLAEKLIEELNDDLIWDKEDFIRCNKQNEVGKISCIKLQKGNEYIIYPKSSRESNNTNKVGEISYIKLKKGNDITCPKSSRKSNNDNEIKIETKQFNIKKEDCEKSKIELKSLKKLISSKKQHKIKGNKKYKMFVILSLIHI